jgi:hypothetical protein
MQCETCPNLKNKPYGKYCAYHKKMFFSGITLKNYEKNCEYGSGFSHPQPGFFSRIMSGFFEKVVGLIG